MTNLSHEAPRDPAPRPQGALAAEAEARLHRSRYFALRDVMCECTDGDVRLRGRLPTYYLKQLAQAVIAEIDGVTSILNQIEVVALGARPPLGRDRPRRDIEPSVRAEA